MLRTRDTTGLEGTLIIMAPPKNEKNQIFLGSFVHSVKLDKLADLHETAVFVDQSGKIVHIEQHCDEPKARQISQQNLAWDNASVRVERTTQNGDFFFPGFIGTTAFPPSTKDTNSL